ncbi:glutathione S-transferase T3-like [Salvia hispanica]|uniref:glutathione S-transferase T3-like n=1 Tax=Salvia hispanica TaxID=49212 RepID=UPI0020094C67|nr:glutathione S-transferase T3-like [Salvia hispanica]
MSTAPAVGEEAAVTVEGGRRRQRGRWRCRRQRRSTHYTKAESIVVARALDAVMSDAPVGTNHTELSFWRRVLVAYDDFKPRGAVPREPDQIHKKWGRILRAVKRFAGIYENNQRTAESGRSEAGVKALSFSMFNTKEFPKFGYWEEYLVL